MNRRGFTLIEILVALAILMGGTTVLWWGLRTGFVFDQHLRHRQQAEEALISQAEQLQGRPQMGLEDTLYGLPAGGGKTLMVRRTVLDSARRENLFDPLEFDDKMRQAWKDRPLEVLLQAWIVAGDSIPENQATTFSAASSIDTMRLFLVLPDYQWY